MNQINAWIEDYLSYCTFQKGIDPKTIKAYSIDLKKFAQFICAGDGEISKEILQAYITQLYCTYKASTVRRKIASLRVFFTYLETAEILSPNPFSQLRIKLHKPQIHPQIIPLETVNALFQYAYWQKANSRTEKQYRAALRDVAVLELLFATGLRISELCVLRAEAVNVTEGTITVCGKGVRTRLLRIRNPDAIAAVAAYYKAFSSQIAETGWFLVNRIGNRLSEQSIVNMVKKCATAAGVNQHITPRMLRNSFAVMLLEENVDIRNVQQILGHNDIVTTQVYGFVATDPPQDIPAAKYPRSKISID